MTIGSGFIHRKWRRIVLCCSPLSPHVLIWIQFNIKRGVTKIEGLQNTKRTMTTTKKTAQKQKHHTIEFYWCILHIYIRNIHNTNVHKNRDRQNIYISDDGKKLEISFGLNFDFVSVWFCLVSIHVSLVFSGTFCPLAKVQVCYEHHIIFICWPDNQYLNSYAQSLKHTNTLA